MSEEGTDHLELELQRLVSYLVGSGTRILALWEEQQVLLITLQFPSLLTYLIRDICTWLDSPSREEFNEMEEFHRSGKPQTTWL